MPDRLKRYVRRAAPLIIVLSLAFPLSECTWTTGDTDQVGYSFARDVFPIDNIEGIAILAIITLPILSVVIGIIRRRQFGLFIMALRSFCVLGLCRGFGTSPVTRVSGLRVII